MVGREGNNRFQGPDGSNGEVRVWRPDPAGVKVPVDPDVARGPDCGCPIPSSIRVRYSSSGPHLGPRFEPSARAFHFNMWMFAEKQRLSPVVLQSREANRTVKDRDVFLFRFFGTLMAAFGLLGLSLAVTNLRAVPPGGHDLRILALPFVFLVGVGVGLFLLRKWAGILFVLTCGVAALWLILGSVLFVPFPGLLVNLFFGGYLLVPCYCVIRDRAALR